MTKDLLGRVDRVLAIEPDDRMRTILSTNLPEVTALRGTGESMPIGTSSVDVVLASASWHWMDPDQALQEAARVLVPRRSPRRCLDWPGSGGPFHLAGASHAFRDVIGLGGTDNWFRW